MTEDPPPSGVHFIFVRGKHRWNFVAHCIVFFCWCFFSLPFFDFDFCFLLISVGVDHSLPHNHQYSHKNPFPSPPFFLSITSNYVLRTS